MVIILKHGYEESQLEAVKNEMESHGVNVMVSRGSETTILGAEGNASKLDVEKLEIMRASSA